MTCVGESSASFYLSHVHFTSSNHSVYWTPAWISNIAFENHLRSALCHVWGDRIGNGIGVGIGMLKKADVRVLDPTVASLTCYKNQDAVNQLSSYLPKKTNGENIFSTHQGYKDFLSRNLQITSCELFNGSCDGAEDLLNLTKYFLWYEKDVAEEVNSGIHGLSHCLK